MGLNHDVTSEIKLSLNRFNNLIADSTNDRLEDAITLF